MTKIFEALEKAAQGPQGNGGNAVRLAAARPLERTMQSLCQRIDMMVERPDGKIIEFTGVQPNEDSSRLACEFALAASNRLFRRVLLLASSANSRVLKTFSIARLTTWDQYISGDAPKDAIIQPVTETLSVGQLSITGDNLPMLLRSPRLGGLLGELRQEYDLILLDAPAPGRSSEATQLSPLADGVILTVEARRTRWQVAKHVIDQISGQKGNVIGIILNKRRFYIPGFIYRRL